jgi:hypothetical protein
MFAAALLVGSGCNSTALKTTWKDPSAGSLSFKNVVVVVLNSSPAERRAQEDTLAGWIKRARATPSYTLISDDELNDVPQAKQKIIAGGFDGAVVLRLVDSRQETTFVPGTESSWEDGWHATHYPQTPSYVITDTIVRAEVSLYAVPSGKLLWAGASETVNPSDARVFVTDVAKAAAEELKKQGLLR